ncbi:lipoprotein [Mycoplasma mycoides]|uniref:lipoprotein n=1 Tax=Mycoplasma mycoides TaxID=2102 RepID=UPI0022409D49|nr:lipoprotein [Mycoplasma mycoides]QVJ95491.1 lipoprotein [Mycoplasma mycoides subsp. capri]
MKKLLTILGSVGLVATTSAAVIACGDKTSQKTPDKKEEEKSADSKKEEKEKTEEESKKEKEEEKKEIDSESPKKDLDLGVLAKDENRYNSVSQSEIKKKLAKLLQTEESSLTDLKVEYGEESGKGTVRSPKHADPVKFTFVTVLDLGNVPTTKNKDKEYVSNGKIKEELAKKLELNQGDLYNLHVDSSNGNSGTGTVKSSKFSGTISFKFTIKEQKNK